MLGEISVRFIDWVSFCGLAVGSAFDSRLKSIMKSCRGYLVLFVKNLLACMPDLPVARCSEHPVLLAMLSETVWVLERLIEDKHETASFIQIVLLITMPVGKEAKHCYINQHNRHIHRHNTHAPRE